MCSAERRRTIAGILAALSIAAAQAPADVPRLIHYQGRLRMAGGLPVTAPQNMRFRIYDHPTHAAPVLFDESHAAVPISDGLFSVLIGSQTVGGVDDAAMDADPLYLGITIDGGAELLPRPLIVSAPHAFKSRSAEQLVRPGTYAPAAIVDSAGRIGIGTTDPQGLLDINGTLALGGSKGAAGQLLTSQGPSLTPVWQTPAAPPAPPFNHIFPDELTNVTPVIQRSLVATPYTVPAGKTLYITAIGDPSGAVQNLTISGVFVRAAAYESGSSGNASHEIGLPILAAAGEIVSATANSLCFAGFLVNPGVIPVTRSLTSSGPVTFAVPADKTLYINGIATATGTAQNMTVDGGFVHTAAFTSGSSGTVSRDLVLPILVPAGSVVGSQAGSLTINGYLRDN